MQHQLPKYLTSSLSYGMSSIVVTVVICSKRLNVGCGDSNMKSAKWRGCTPLELQSGPLCWCPCGHTQLFWVVVGEGILYQCIKATCYLFSGSRVFEVKILWDKLGGRSSPLWIQSLLLVNPLHWSGGWIKLTRSAHFLPSWIPPACSQITSAFDVAVDVPGSQGRVLSVSTTHPFYRTWTSSWCPWEYPGFWHEGYLATSMRVWLFLLLLALHWLQGAQPLAPLFCHCTGTWYLKDCCQGQVIFDVQLGDGVVAVANGGG